MPGCTNDHTNIHTKHFSYTLYIEIIDVFPSKFGGLRYEILIFRPHLMENNRRVGDFQVATGGGFWVATREVIHRQFSVCSRVLSSTGITCWLPPESPAGFIGISNYSPTLTLSPHSSGICDLSTYALHKKLLLPNLDMFSSGSGNTCSIFDNESLNPVCTLIGCTLPPHTVNVLITFVEIAPKLAGFSRFPSCVHHLPSNIIGQRYVSIN
jgi:hypothetical protein